MKTKTLLKSYAEEYSKRVILEELVKSMESEIRETTNELKERIRSLELDLEMRNGDFKKLSVPNKK